MQFLAHTENPKGLVHGLKEHLSEVGKLAAQFIAAIRPELAEQARWAGLLHDLGKYRNEFQDYLLGKREGGPDTHHAVYGAALAAQKGWLALALAIAGHHAGLHNPQGEHSLKGLITRPEYKMAENLPPLIAKFEAELEKLPATLATPDYFRTDLLRTELAVRMLFSALVDADFLDTETHYQAQARPALLAFDPGALLAKAEAARQAKVAEATKRGNDAKLIKLRNEIFADCLERAADAPGFFTLTVPTGGGKTLSGMAFALRHAEVHKLRRVIVVIPYLSIIEQNAKEYRDILDPDGTGLIIENHSAVAVKAEKREETGKTEARQRDPLVLAAENWDAPIVVTTSVQFIESLFANKPSRCRKLHNLAHSVVIFDEVQTLPAHLLEPLFGVWRELAHSYGVSFVFSTATQPAFRQQFNLTNGFIDGELREITRNTAQTFRDLQRVRYELPDFANPRAWPDIAAEMAEAQQVMCVVNTRRQAFELWSILRGRLAGNLAETTDSGLFHLSSAMCAEHRLKVITEIKKRLLNDEPCRVVATQLVEAGVDVDFPLLYRALAPLDSIVQAAGRCNREGRADFGRVKVFVPAQHTLPPGLYKVATEVTSALLPRYGADRLAVESEIFGDYFSRIYQLTATGANIEAARRELKFRDVAQAVKVIEDAGTGVIVPFGGDNGPALKIVTQLRGKNAKAPKLRFGREDLRRLQRFMVNLKPRDYETLLAKRQLQPLIPNHKLDLQVVDVASYHEHLGVLVNDFPTDEWTGGV